MITLVPIGFESFFIGKRRKRKWNRSYQNKNWFAVKRCRIFGLKASIRLAMRLRAHTAPHSCGKNMAK